MYQFKYQSGDTICEILNNSNFIGMGLTSSLILPGQQKKRTQNDLPTLSRYAVLIDSRTESALQCFDCFKYHVHYIFVTIIQTTGDSR